MAKMNVFESTNMATTHYAERILDAVCTEDIENGTFGYLQASETEGEIPTFVKGYKAGETVVVADNPAWNETMVNGVRHSDVRRDKYTNIAGVPFRVRTVKKGDTFATAIEGVTSATQEKMKYGAFVTIDSTTGKLVASDKTAVVTGQTPSSPIMEAKVEKVRMVGGTIATAAHNYGYSTKMYEATVKILA